MGFPHLPDRRAWFSSSRSAFSLRTKMCIGVSILIIALMTTVLVLNDRSTAAAVKETLVLEMQSAQEALKQMHAQSHQELDHELRVLVQTPRIKALVTTPGIDYATMLDIAHDVSALVEVDLFVLVDAYGRVLIDMTEPEHNGDDLGQTPAISTTLRGESFHGIQKVHGRLHHTAAAPIMFGDHIVGALLTGVVIDPHQLQHLAEATGSGIALVGDDIGLASSDLDGLLDVLVSQFAGPGLSDFAAGIASLEANGSLHLVSYGPLGIPGTRYLIVQSLDEHLSQFRMARNEFVGLSCLLLAFALIAALTYSRFLTRPIEALILGTRRIAGGNLDSRVEVSTDDEFGELAKSFNAMATDVKANISKAAELAAATATANAERQRTAVLKVAYNDLKDTQSRLVQSEKMAAIGVLTGGIAHEFNNFLGAILGSADMASKNVPADDPAYPHIQRTLRASRRAQKLIKHLLAFSRSRQADSERGPVAIADAVAEAVSLVDVSRSATTELRYTVAPGFDAMVLSEETQIQQIVLNLASNACHAMAEAGGLLEVRLESVEVDDTPSAEDPESREGKYVKLTVTDTGVGMSPEIQTKIFDPFFTTKTVDEGTGLGLAMIHGIVEEHGGWITVSSVPNGGTTFEIHLPQIHGLAPEPCQPSVPALERDDLGASVENKAVPAK